LKSTGISLHNIAKQVCKDVSTISREIARNTGGRGYRFNQADNAASARRSKASQTSTKMTEELTVTIDSRLSEDWSPEQISGRLKLEGVLISHESIYLHVWADKQAGGALYQHLRHHGKRYNKRSSGKAGRGCIPNRVDITERPAIVKEKTRIGDWEGDTVISAVSKTALLTLVDRCSKFTLMKKIGQKTAENVRVAMAEKMREFPHPAHTITYDNGMEFAAHEDIANDLNSKVYFATPYHSWERGLNEHTNGLIRQYLKKRLDFKNVTDDEVQLIENKLNNRPRKVLQYRTPFEVAFAGTHSTPGVALQT
jgi:IS30 family transposase